MKDAPLIWVDKFTILRQRIFYDRWIICYQISKAFFHQTESLCKRETERQSERERDYLNATARQRK